MPAILRAADLTLQTLAERYGIPADEKIADTTWLADATTDGRACLMKDSAIATNPLELACVKATGARCFALADKSLPAHRMAAWFLNNLDDIAVACAAGGPFVYEVTATALVVIA